MSKSTGVPVFWTLMAVLLLTACQPIRPDQDTDAPSAAAAPTPTPPATRFTLQPPTDGETGSAAELFAAISPAVAFVDTPLGTGSAVLIQDNYLLTNAHVVWPFTEVRVVFPDGSELPNAPVAGWDLIADLALIGPVETQIEPVPLVDPGDLPVGSEVYLIGYPAEYEPFPQPSITTGIISRLRSWERLDYTFFQVDAAAIEGQSGGVMVTDTGDVVGLSTFIFSGFGLAGSIADALPRLNTLLGHDLGVTIEPRGLPQGEGQREFEETLQDDFDLHRYLLRTEVGAEVELSVEGIGLPLLYALPAGGGYWLESEMRGPDEKQTSLSLTVESGDPYIVEVQQLSTNENSYLLTSSHPLLAYPDPDDGHALAAGDSYLGVVDAPDDVDVFELDLNAGDRVRIDVDAIGIDAWVGLYYESDSFEESITDDDSGGGLFGENSSIAYEAPRDGTYLLVVEEFSEEGVGSYFISVTVPTAAAQLTEPDVSRQVRQSSYGKMAWYESDRYGFSILEPVEWEAMTAEECEPFVVCYFWEPYSYVLVEGSLNEFAPQEPTRAEFVGSLDESMAHEPDTEKLSSETVTTLQGLEAHRIDYVIDGGQSHATVFAYVDEEENSFFVFMVYVVTEDKDEIDALADFLVDSFRVWDSDQRDDSAVFHLDEAQRLWAESAFEEALAAYGRSIELDPELREAYSGRASLHNERGRHEEALLDADRALELDPGDPGMIQFRAFIFWYMGRLDDALAEMDLAIALEAPPRAGSYNNRALMLTDNGEYDRALADIEKAIELNDGELPPYMQDTRGYIYLSMGELEKALADYEAVLEQDMRFIHTLLGAGIIHAQFGDKEKAAELIDEAMERRERFLEDGDPDPQLAALLEMAAEFTGEKADSQ